MRERCASLVAIATDWWATYSGFIILPFAAVAFCVTVYEMLHGVM